MRGDSSASGISQKGQIRIKKAEKLVGELIGEYLRHAMPRGSNMILSVTRVELSRDLKYGQIFVHSLGPATLALSSMGNNSDLDQSAAVSQLDPKQQKALQDLVDSTLDLLDEHRPRIQVFLGKEMKSKFVPKLTFQYDHGWEKGQQVDEILRNINPSSKLS